MTKLKNSTVGIILLFVFVGVTAVMAFTAKAAELTYLVYLPIVEKAPPILTIDPVVRAPGSNVWTISWTGGEDAPVVEYVLEEAADAAFTSPTVYTATETFVDFDYGASVNQVFYYRVRADGSWGEGPWSESVRIVGVYYFDDFSNPASGWDVKDSGTSSFGYVDDQYKISVNKAFVLSAANAPNLFCDGYEVSVDANWASGSTKDGIYALVFGANNALDNYYFLAVRSDIQQYNLFLFNDGKLKSITHTKDWVQSPNINKDFGVNKLHVARLGSSIKVSINDVYQDTFSDGTLTGVKLVGVMTAPLYENDNGDVANGRYDNFTLGACGLTTTQPLASATGAVSGSSEFAVDFDGLK